GANADLPAGTTISADLTAVDEHVRGHANLIRSQQAACFDRDPARTSQGDRAGVECAVYCDALGLDRQLPSNSQVLGDYLRAGGTDGKTSGQSLGLQNQRVVPAAVQVDAGYVACGGPRQGLIEERRLWIAGMLLAIDRDFQEARGAERLPDGGIAAIPVEG